MSDLVAFVRARLDEDEAMAKAARCSDGVWWRRTWQAGGEEKPVGGLLEGEPELDADGEVCGADYIIVYDEGAPDEAQFGHIARWDPARVLREVEAKRALIASALSVAESIDGEWGDGHDQDQIEAGMCRDYGGAELLRVLAPFATIYADHPDYDPAWA